MGRGGTLLDVFDADIHAEKRKDNTYPFASREEWETASFYLYHHSSVSAITNSFMELVVMSYMKW